MSEHLNQWTAPLVVADYDSDGSAPLRPHDLLQETTSSAHKQHDLALDVVELFQIEGIIAARGRHVVGIRHAT
jgi:hypothetical protein